MRRLSVWWDQTLRTGEAFDEVTEEALEAARAVVVLWSKTSVKSRWVRAEATTADRNRTSMPVMIEDCRRPIMFELRQTADLSHWDGGQERSRVARFPCRLKRFLQENAPADSSSDAVLEAPAESYAGRQAWLTPTGTRRRCDCRSRPGHRWCLALAAQRDRKPGTRRNSANRSARRIGGLRCSIRQAQEIRRVLPDDSLLKSLTPRFTAVYTVTSKPAGAEVLVRSYDDARVEWRRIGTTPLENVELPRHAMRWRFEKQGFQTAERANSVLANQADGGVFLGVDVSKLEVTLRPMAEGPADMVFVPGGSSANAIERLRGAEVPPFLIDRHETTNAEYKEFVDAGGYERPSWWDFDIKRNGQPLSFDEAMRLFVDATGRAGPADWELGNFPDGKANYPVAGISWYEAAAYARFREKSLPTPHHFVKAAFQELEIASSLAALTAPLSNLGTAGPAPVEQFQGVGPFGTYDLFGNVREWLQNPGPGGGWVMGGSWEDPSYSFASVAPVPLLERSRLNGIRLIKYLSEPANGTELRAAIDMSSRSRRDLTKLEPVTDQVYESLARQFSYSLAR